MKKQRKERKKSARFFSFTPGWHGFSHKNTPQTQFYYHIFASSPAVDRHSTILTARRKFLAYIIYMVDNFLPFCYNEANKKGNFCPFFTKKGQSNPSKKEEENYEKKNPLLCFNHGNGALHARGASCRNRFGIKRHHRGWHGCRTGCHCNCKQ